MGGSWDYMASIEVNTWETSLHTRRAADEAARNAQAQINATWAVEEQVRSNGYSLEALRRDVQRSMEANTEGFSRLSTITEQGLKTIAKRMDHQQATLNSIDTTLQNPKAAQARELFRTGVKTLSLGLVDESVKLFQEALDFDSLQPILHMAMAVTLNASSKQRESFTHLELAYKYSEVQGNLTPNGSWVNPLSIRAAAGIMAADIASSEDEEVTAFKMLKSVIEENKTYPEVSYSLARLAARRNDDVTALEALSLSMRYAPENAVRAYREGLPGVESLAEKLANEDIMFKAMRTVIGGVEELAARQGRKKREVELYSDPAILMASYPSLRARYLSSSVKEQVQDRYEYLTNEPVIDSSRLEVLRDSYEGWRARYEAACKTHGPAVPAPPGRFATRRAREAYDSSLHTYETLVKPTFDHMKEAEEKLNAFLAEHEAKHEEWQAAQADLELISNLSTYLLAASRHVNQPFSF